MEAKNVASREARRAARLALLARERELTHQLGRFGWDGGFGTSWWCDPREDLIGILLAQRLWDPGWMALHEAFWNLAYAAIPD